MQRTREKKGEKLMNHFSENERLFSTNCDIFERKIRNAVKETTALSDDTKAHILLCIEDELREKFD